MRLVVFSMLVVGLTLAACSSDDSPNQNDTPVATGCAGDNRKDIYTAGLSKPAGTLSVQLVESKPGPPIKGTNAMTIEVLDPAKQPVDGATITVTPWMPDHAHGSAVKPVVTGLGGGKYSIEKIYLSMAGLWQIKVGVQPSGGGPLQEAVFQFCLDG